jgi:hypothetical protein
MISDRIDPDLLDLENPRQQARWTERGQCPEWLSIPFSVSASSQDWREILPQLLEVAGTLAARGRSELKLLALQAQINLLHSRLDQVQDRFCLTVPVQSFAPEPIEVIKPISVVVRMASEDFIATFFDANISASGETEVEAVVNLKDMIAAVFECLDRSLKQNELGPGPKRQLTVLRQFIRWSA